MKRNQNLQREAAGVRHVSVQAPQGLIESLSWVLCLFNAIGIPLHPSHKSFGKLKTFLRCIPEILFHAASLFIIATSVSMVRFCRVSLCKVDLGTLIHVLAGLALRYAIYWHRFDVRRCILRMHLHRPEYVRASSLAALDRFVRTASVVSAANCVLVFSLTLLDLLSNRKPRAYYLKMAFFDLVADADSFPAKLVVGLSLFLDSATIMTPNCAFGVLYCALAFHVSEIYTFLAAEGIRSFRCLDSLLREYAFADYLLTEMDSSLCLLVFVTFFNASGAIYYPLVAVLYSEFSPYRYIPSMVLLIVNVSIVSAMCVCASKVHDARQSMLQMLASSKHEDQFFIKKLWFVLKIKQGIRLTAGKVYLPTYQFIALYLGTIFTYSLLIDSF